jgi:hypothetical protein
MKTPCRLQNNSDAVALVKMRALSNVFAEIELRGFAS